MDLHDFRRQYQSKGLNRQALDNSPFSQFERWMNEIVELDTTDPTAMILATTEGKQPTQRIVLLKQFDESGFVFFTNRMSAKGKQMSNNKAVSLHFPWHFVNRQVIIQGSVELLSRDEDVAYFHSRPKASQWGARASRQSEVLSSRQELLDRYENEKRLHPNNIPAPDCWGGYRVVPSVVEFWEGGEDRLHNRFVYERQQTATGTEWSIQRLSP